MLEFRGLYFAFFSCKISFNQSQRCETQPKRYEIRFVKVLAMITVIMMARMEMMMMMVMVAMFVVIMMMRMVMAMVIMMGCQW